MASSVELKGFSACRYQEGNVLKQGYNNLICQLSMKFSTECQRQSQTSLFEYYFKRRWSPPGSLIMLLCRMTPLWHGGLGRYYMAHGNFFFFLSDQSTINLSTIVPSASLLTCGQYLCIKL